jgi:hypothetical protein
MVRHQIADGFLNGSITHLHFDQFIRAVVQVRAHIRLLAGIELRIDVETVLEIVDAESRSFPEADRAQVSGDFNTALMGSLNCRSQNFTRNEIVRFEIVHPAIDPEVHCVDGFLRRFEFRHLRRPTARALQVGSGYMHVRAGDIAFINLPFDGQVGIRLDAAGGANGSDTARQIEARKADRHFVENGISGGIEHMIVHADESWDQGVIMEIDHLGFTRDVGRATHQLDLPMRDKNGLICERRGPRPVNDTHVCQSNSRRVDFDELPHLG